MQLILRKKSHHQLGATVVEYALVLAVIVTMVMAGAKLMDVPIQSTLICAGEKMKALASGGEAQCTDEGGNDSKINNNANSNQPAGIPAYPIPPSQPKTGDGSGEHGQREPTEGDIKGHDDWRNIANAADLLGLDNASDHMNHYLDNTGDELNVSVEDMLDASASFNKDSSEFFEDEVLDAVNNRIANEYDGSYLSFQVTTDWELHSFVKNAEKDLFYAIGTLSYSYGAEVIVTPDPLGGDPRITVNYQMHVFDRYNWDSGKGVTIAGIPVADSSLGSLHQAGLAHEYEIVGTSQVQQINYSYGDKMDTSNYNSPNESERNQ